MKTFIAKPQNVVHNWLLLDAEGLTLGRMAAEIASRLRGKHKPEYTPHVDTGDFIVVINAEKIKLTGTSKASQRVYKRYSGYPGGQKVTTAEEMLEKHPERIIQEAVRRMLPKTTLGRAMFSKLKVFVGAEHTHQAQKPEVLEF